VLEVIEYENHMDAWKAGQDITEVPAVKVCVVGHKTKQKLVGNREMQIHTKKKFPWHYNMNMNVDDTHN
jgi:hypothetical protein